MVALAKKAFLQFIGFALFLLAGGLIFRAVENTGGKVREEKEKALKSLKTNMKSKYNMTARDFDEFTKAAHDALTPSPGEWTLSESTLFAMTVCTTIGESLAIVLFLDHLTYLTWFLSRDETFLRTNLSEYKQK